MEKERTGKTSMIITWLGHGCFGVEAEGYTIVLDPYEDNYVPGLAPLRVRANEVFCSHGHRDHNFTEAVELIPGQASPFRVTEMEVLHDDQGGAIRGTCTARILECGGLRVAHLSDLGAELTKEQKEALQGLDAVMVPVGGYYTIDAAQAVKLVKELKPRVIIPMHYRSKEFGYDVLGTLEPFTDAFEVVVEYPGSSLELTEDTEPHVAVLRVEGR